MIKQNQLKKNNFAPENFFIFSAEKLQKLMCKISVEIPGVIQGGDIENIHRMRVAVRRMRAALKLFQNYLPVKTVRFLKKRMPVITNSLGNARDTDVQIDRLKIICRTIKIKKNILILMRKMLDTNLFAIAEKRLIIAKIESEINFLKKNYKKKFSPEKEIRSIIRNIVKEVFKYEHCIDLPDKSNSGLHEMRKKLKYLRYSVEICNNLFGSEAEQIIENIKDLQTFLGDVHDYETLNLIIEPYFEEELNIEPLDINYVKKLNIISKIKPGILYLRTIFNHIFTFFAILESCVTFFL